VDTTGPTGHHRPHWKLLVPLDTKGLTGHYRPQWTLQVLLDTTGPTGHYRPHWTLQTPLDTTGPTGHYRPHWTLQASLVTTDHTGHYMPHWAPQAPLDTTSLTKTQTTDSCVSCRPRAPLGPTIQTADCAVHWRPHHSVHTLRTPPPICVTKATELSDFRTEIDRPVGWQRGTEGGEMLQL
jgi:hypothetical protein